MSKATTKKNFFPHTRQTLVFWLSDWVFWLPDQGVIMAVSTPWFWNKALAISNIIIIGSYVFHMTTILLYRQRKLVVSLQHAKATGKINEISIVQTYLITLLLL